MPPNNPIGALIDAKIEYDGRFGKADQGVRRYIGGSSLGHPCDRNNWYGFHWSSPPERFEARMLRLFDRGHREEERLIECLRLIGCEVEEHDPATIPMLFYHPESDSYIAITQGQFYATDDDARQGAYHLTSQCDDVTGTYHEWIARSRGVEIPEPKQFAWKAFNGHHMGHTDGRARNVPGVELFGLTALDWLLCEFKTHNDKNFATLIDVREKGGGIKESKNQHWVQMQRYMEKMGLLLGLYGGVNKNDDHLYWEFVPLDGAQPAVADARTLTAIYARKPPKRISTSPSWFECKYCNHRPQCHFGAPLERNCRSCVSSMPVAQGDNGDWFCQRWGKMIPHDAEKLGCAMFKQIDD